MKALLWIIVVGSCALVALASSIYPDDRYMHEYHKYMKYANNKQQPDYEDAEFWRKDAQEELAIRTQIKPIEAEAKNIIFYLGDGMSVPTVTAARILKGQKVDGLEYGEEGKLHMDSFPYIGTSKTYCVDSQVADSACSATAYLCGTKANMGTIGVNSNVPLTNCLAQANPANHVSSVLAWAQAKGKSTGVLTTTRITHASPSGAYAHIADRDWENDGAIKDDGGDPTVCEDIAKQLIMREPGYNINVILGGGRRQFTPNTTRDIEYPEVFGYRRDGLNLINIWSSLKPQGANASYVWNRTNLLNIDVAKTDYLLGLFEPSHVSYLHEQGQNEDPSLEEMVTVAIQMLSKNPNGFFLFVEGGRIDHAHHDNQPERALWETIEFDKAIQKGDNMTDDKDTLIIITSDHAHVMHIAGYPERGTNIMGHGSSNIALDDLPYPTLGYGNGPGGPFIDPETGKRYDIRQDNVDNVTLVRRSPVPMSAETHGGDDVLIFAKGPYAHLLTGVHEQSYIPHVLGYAACIGNGAKHCDP